MATVYEIITERIIKQLENGTVPWHRPWNGGGPDKNLSSGKPYRGINTWLLAGHKYTSPYWLSYKQAQDRGGQVRAGEKGTMVVFWKKSTYTKNSVDPETGTEEETKKSGFILRYYTVFNVAQCDGIEAPATETREFQPIEECEKLVAIMPNRPEIRHNEQRAYYRPSEDIVNMPKKETFLSDEEFYSTLFHELVHSTGHDSRLGRHKAQKCNHHFGSADYSKEELVAEMGAAYLCAMAGIENKTIDNSAAYIQGWLKNLKNDSRMIVFAAAQAQKAADYIGGPP